jgi:hypothetical protein
MGADEIRGALTSNGGARRQSTAVATPQLKGDGALGRGVPGEGCWRAGLQVVSTTGHIEGVGPRGRSGRASSTG